MTQQITYQTTENVAVSAKYPLDLFFQDWLSDTCTGRYSVKSSKTFEDSLYYRMKVTFDDPADALMLKLMGLPDDLSPYITIEE